MNWDLIGNVVVGICIYKVLIGIVGGILNGLSNRLVKAQLEKEEK